MNVIFQNTQVSSTLDQFSKKHHLILIWGNSWRKDKQLDSEHFGIHSKFKLLEEIQSVYCLFFRDYPPVINWKTRKDCIARTCSSCTIKDFLKIFFSEKVGHGTHCLRFYFVKTIIATKHNHLKRCTNIPIWTAHECSRWRHFERDSDFVQVPWAEGWENQANAYEYE